MKKKIVFQLLISFCTVMVSCTNDKATTATEETPVGDNTKKEDPSSNAGIVLQAPGFTDPALMNYFSNYTAYLKRLVAAIRSKDETATMKLFLNEGKQFDNRNEMEQKARSTPEEEQKFTTWLMQSAPYQTEIIKSEYYKKYTGEHYKKVQEEFKKKNY